MARDKLRNFLWYKSLVNFFLFFAHEVFTNHEYQDCLRPTSLMREFTTVTRRQTYKTFGVGHNSFQDTRHAQEVTSCSWAARQIICYPRWVHRVCWSHVHLEVYHRQHSQELASPQSCKSLFDYLRATMESTGDSLVESIHFPGFFHVQHQDQAIHVWWWLLLLL